MEPDHGFAIHRCQYVWIGIIASDLLTTDLLPCLCLIEDMQTIAIFINLQKEMRREKKLRSIRRVFDCGSYTHIICSCMQCRTLDNKDTSASRTMATNYTLCAFCFVFTWVREKIVCQTLKSRNIAKYSIRNSINKYSIHTELNTIYHREQLASILFLQTQIRMYIAIFYQIKSGDAETSRTRYATKTKTRKGHTKMSPQVHHRAVPCAHNFYSSLWPILSDYVFLSMNELRTDFSWQFSILLHIWPCLFICLNDNVYLLWTL